MLEPSDKTIRPEYLDLSYFLSSRLSFPLLVKDFSPPENGSSEPIAANDAYDFPRNYSRATET